MLVKESIVERWYQTDSWVYKNFVYLFQNPLWNKTVPRGFSVCPYFWLSLFSMCIFRPFFVLPVRRLVLPVLVGIGRPALASDKALYLFIDRKVRRSKSINDYFPGGGVALTIMLLFAIALLCILGTLVYAGLAPLKVFYVYLTSASDLGMFVWWSITSFLALLGVLGAHKAFTSSECKTVNYVYLWAALFAAAFVLFLPHETSVGTTATTNAVLVALAFVGKWAWFGLQVAAKALWSFVTWAPIKAIYAPWWLYVTLLGFAGYFVDRVLSYCEGLKTEVASNQDNQARNRQAWLNLFLRVLYTVDSSGGNWKGGEVFQEIRGYNLLTENHYWPEACLCHRDLIYKKAFETLFADYLSLLQGSSPCAAKQKLNWNAISMHYESTNRFDLFCRQAGISLPFHRSGFVNAIMEACRETDIRAQIDKTIAELHATEIAWAERKEARKTSPMHLACLRVTSAVGSALNRVAVGTAWVGTQSWTIMAYLWMLAKAKKQGACPYFRFRDPSQEVLDNLNGNDTLGQ